MTDGQTIASGPPQPVVMRSLSVPFRQVKEPMPPGGWHPRKKRLMKKRAKFEAVVARAGQAASRRIWCAFEEQLFGSHNVTGEPEGATK